jgi:6,7-dimethyl-8-ribityllumazine synthase
LETVWVPGAFEIPLALRSLARGGKFDALIALGAVIRGDTPHFDYVCEGATHGTMQVMLDTGVPIAFGVLTTDTLRQAQERTGGRHGNKGIDAALTALEMARMVKMYG